MIRVLCVNISGVDTETYQHLYAAACEERKIRADRYLRSKDALRCVIADALLRYAVSQTPGITFCIPEYTAEGKPYLKESTQFHYNLSHSGNWVVIAFGENEVGVDIEQIRTDIGIESIAQQFFTREEQEYIFYDPTLASQHFFQVWTGKESYLKFLGTGLKQPLYSFSVFSPEVAKLLRRRILDGNYYLTLCSTHPYCTFELLSVEQLI